MTLDDLTLAAIACSTLLVACGPRVAIASARPGEARSPRFGATARIGGIQALDSVRIPSRGVLTDDRGKPLQGRHTLRVRLYDHASAGEPWHEEVFELELDNGGFAIGIGDVETLDLRAFATREELFVALQVDGDEEMMPRLRGGTVPFAAYAAADQRTNDSGPRSRDARATRSRSLARSIAIGSARNVLVLVPTNRRFRTNAARPRWSSTNVSTSG